MKPMTYTELLEFMKTLSAYEAQISKESTNKGKNMGEQAMNNQEPVDDSKYNLTDTPNVKWSEVCGLEEAKQQMIEAIELPHQSPEIYEYYNKKLPKGCLLYGPPGCGKTMLAKAAATSMAKIYGEGDNLKGAFIYIKGSEVLNKFVGESEKNVRDIFKRARAHKKKHGYPAIIFIDEADGLLSSRYGKNGIRSDSMTVATFLAEMDGLDDSGGFVILATNRPDVLDPAITRDGRIDRKIKITRPELKDAIEIFKLNLKKTPLVESTTINMAKLAANLMYSDDRKFYAIHKADDEYEYLRLRDVINGAMIANVVDYGTSLAIRRDLAAKTMTGLTQEDIRAAVDYIESQNRDVNHDNEIESRVSQYRDDVISITKVAA